MTTEIGAGEVSVEGPPVEGIAPTREEWDGLRRLGQLLQGKPPDPGLDWMAVAELAQRHGVSPLLCHTLSPFLDQVPSGAWQVLQDDFYTAVAHSLRRERQLEQILEALDETGIQVVLLKGAALARSVYPDPALRVMGDLDLWVSRDNLDGAREALGMLEYDSLSKPQRPLPLQDAFLGETQMVSQQPGMSLVELHWNAFPGEWLRHAAQIDEAAVWERSVPLDGTTVNQLSPEDAVLQACLHFAINHQLSGLGSRPLLDLELMCQRWEIDWDTVVHRARSWRVSVATWLILDLWSLLFGHDDDLLSWQTLCPSKVRRWLLRRFVSLQLLEQGRTPKKGIIRRLFLLTLVDRPGDAVLLFGRAFFPDREWLTLLYGLEGAPAWRIRLQQMWHPFRVLVRGDI